MRSPIATVRAAGFAGAIEESRREEKKEKETDWFVGPSSSRRTFRPAERGAVGIPDLEPTPADARDRLVQILVLRRTAPNVIAEKGIACASVVNSKPMLEDHQKTAENPDRRAPAAFRNTASSVPQARSAIKNRRPRPFANSAGGRTLTERKAPRCASAKPQ
jgi:hypothetical protein